MYQIEYWLYHTYSQHLFILRIRQIFDDGNLALHDLSVFLIFNISLITFQTNFPFVFTQGFFSDLSLNN